MKRKSIFISTTFLIIVTLVSKFFGFGREIVIAFLFGASIATDAYLVAVAVPTLFFGTIINAITNVFIPVFDKFKQEKREKSLVYKFTLIGFALTSVFLVLPVFLHSEFIIKIFAPGFSSEAVAQASSMLQILILVVSFRLFSAVATSMLHVNKNFIIPGMEGLPFNIVIVCVSLLFYKQLGIYALVWGSFFGFAAQLLFKVPFIIKANLSGHLSDNCNDGLKQIFLLLPPVLLSSASVQIKAMIDRMFASTLAEGSISYINYAGRLIGLPQSLLIVTVVTVTYPSLVTLVNSGSLKEFKGTILKALSAMQFLLMPITVLTIVLAKPIIEVVYLRGNFTALDVAQTIAPLQFYSLGLVGVMLSRLTTQSLYALKDTVTPMYIAIFTVILNIVLNALLVGHFQHGGLILATSISAWTGGLVMLYQLHSKVGGIGGKLIAGEFMRTLVAAITMGILCYFTYSLSSGLALNNFSTRIAYLSVQTLFGLTIYIFMAWLFKIEGFSSAVDMIKSIWSKVSKMRRVA